MMIIITSFLLLCLLTLTYKRNLYRLYIRCIIVCIKLYLYLLDKLILILPTYIYSSVYKHRTQELDYCVHEYWYKYKNKYYKFRAIEDNRYSLNDACKIYHPDNMNLINHACIINDDKYIRDITKELRYFMYYRGLIEWKYILVHLGIENENKIVLYMNDLDMSEKHCNINEIYNEKFNF
jgi:hypothetical protein